MAHSVSARKRIRQNERHRSRNRWRLRTLRDALKNLDEKLLHASYEEAQGAFRTAAALLDKTAQKGVIHKKTAARRKSRLSTRVKAMKPA